MTMKGRRCPSSSRRSYGCSAIIVLSILLLQQDQVHSKSFGVIQQASKANTRIWSPFEHQQQQRRAIMDMEDRLEQSTCDSSLTLHSMDHDYSKQTVLSVRGGADAAATSEETSSVVMVKVRHLLRSLIQICERKVSPSWAKSLQSAIQSLETILGVSLLSPEEGLIKLKANKNKKTSKKKGGKKKTKSATNATSTTEAKESSSLSSSPSEPEAETSTSSKKKKKAKKAKSSTTETAKPAAKKVVVSSAAQTHLATKLSNTNPNYRIQRELKEFLKDPPPNLSVQVGKNIRIWIVTMQGVGIYKDEEFKLRIQFPPRYPMVPPSVYFLPKVPVHEHVYTNGDICLSLLGEGWRPTMTAQSIAMSILSILGSAQSKSLPMDNARHAQSKPGQYQKDWVYHDDNC